jgi:hypothetical protein
VKHVRTLLFSLGLVWTLVLSSGTALSAPQFTRVDCGECSTQKSCLAGSLISLQNFETKEAAEAAVNNNAEAMLDVFYATAVWEVRCARCPGETNTCPRTIEADTTEATGSMGYCENRGGTSTVVMELEHDLHVWVCCGGC